MQETESRLAFETEKHSIQELDVYKIIGIPVGTEKQGPLPTGLASSKLNPVFVIQRQEAAAAGLPLLSEPPTASRCPWSQRLGMLRWNPANTVVLWPCQPKGVAGIWLPLMLPFKSFETAFNCHYLIHICNLC